MTSPVGFAVPARNSTMLSRPAWAPTRTRSRSSSGHRPRPTRICFNPDRRREGCQATRPRSFSCGRPPPKTIRGPQATWHKANPGACLTATEPARSCGVRLSRHKRLPAGLESGFQQLHLNLRCAAEDHFLSPAVWALNAGDPDPSAIRGLPGVRWPGSEHRQDLTALVLVAKDGTGTVHVQPHFWAPARACGSGRSVIEPPMTCGAIRAC